MTPETDPRIARARELKESGKYNCAQAVACAFAESVGADPEEVMKMTAAFGVGMGSMRATCGALIGAGVIVGLATGDRVGSMKLARGIIEEFAARNGATVCGDLKGVATGRPLRPCADCVADAARLLAGALA